MFEIQVMSKQGKKFKGIARKTGDSINTVRKYARDHKEPKYKVRDRKPQKLDGYRDYLQTRVKQAEPNWLPATVLFSEIKAMGYHGSELFLRAYMSKLKLALNEGPLIRFETEPGIQMQVDYAHFNHNGDKFYAFVAVLSYSRMIYVDFVKEQNIESLIKSHERAFEYFSGIPQNVLYDNMRVAAKQEKLKDAMRRIYGHSKLLIIDELGYHLPIKFKLTTYSRWLPRGMSMAL